MSKANALKAVIAAEEVCHQAFLKLNDVIALRRVLGRDVKQYVRLRTRALRRMQAFTQIKHEIQAASNVVRAPSSAQVAAVQALLAKVKKISVKDAAGKAGMKLIKDGKAIIDTLNDSTRNVRAA